MVTSGTPNAIERMALEARKQNVEYLIRDHLFYSSYKAFQKSLSNKSLKELQSMEYLIERQS